MGNQDQTKAESDSESLGVSISGENEEEGKFDGAIDIGIEIFNHLKFGFSVTVSGGKKAGRKMATMFMVLTAYLVTILSTVALAIVYIKTKGRK